MSQTDRLLVVDPICSRRAPTIRAWLQVAGRVLPQHFQEVEVWSMECDLDLPCVIWRKFPKITRFWPIQCAAFRFMAWQAFRRLSAAYLHNTLIQASGEHLPVADIRYIQFWNIEFVRLAKSKSGDIPVGWKEKIFGGWAAHVERKCLRSGATSEWWCVSRGIAAPIIRETSPEMIFSYLPNSYDPARFSPANRVRFRSESRNLYGFGEEEVVFAFASFGHFVRKGLLQAVEVIDRLRADGLSAKLLVLGGTPSAIAHFQAMVAERGVTSEGIVFAGLVTNSEQHLSAADALFFPSHFEAFSLVEIEAAALGLRLYLTPHPGSEMILREGVNGRMLPWSVDGMTDVLRAEIVSGEIRRDHQELGEALTPSAFAEQISSLYAGAIRRKNSTRPTDTPAAT